MFKNLKKFEIIVLSSALLFLLFSGVFYGYSTKQLNSQKKIKSQVVFNCTGQLSEDFDCFESYYENLTNTNGPKAALDDLEQKKTGNNYLEAHCHPLTHSIGRTAGDKFSSISEAYAAGDALCWSGYYHGVMESVVAKYGLNNLPNEINNICADIPNKEKYTFEYYNCMHGLGHGLMAVTNDELFQALDLCKKLDGLWQQQTCSGGIFMENIIFDKRSHRTRYLKDNDPIYPCNQIDKEFIDNCYGIQSSNILNFFQRDFAKAFVYCQKNAGLGKDSCFQGLGREATGGTVEDVEQAKNVCMALKNFDQKSNCVMGAGINFIAQHHDMVLAGQFCSELTEAKLKDICTKTITKFYKGL